MAQATFGGQAYVFTQSGFADVPGARLHYEVMGSGTPLVLVHGFGLDLRMWDDQFAVLARRFQVIRYDARGFGQSSLPTTGPYTHADDLKGLLAHLGISRAHIMGLSMGGRIATNFALYQPAMVHRLILVDSDLSGYKTSREFNLQVQAIRAEGATRGPKAANDLWLRHPLFAPARENAGAAPRLALMIADYSGWHWVNHDPHLASEPPDSQRLDQIKAATLIFIGQRDLPDFHGMAAVLQQHIPQANTITLPGAGHMTNMEVPEQFNEIVENFLSSA